MYGDLKFILLNQIDFLVNNRFEFINEKGEKDVLEEQIKNRNHIIENLWIDNDQKI